ncbi:hypothetical protein FCV43_14145 [Vibrio genomosp. F6]|nr:hypothetical protein [Vibrio sp. 03-59-1]RBW64268.1 hypothetical protein DS893_15990 [Vibrionales bacterium C3R12]TKF20717.1 hypothetical protein FCV43_14145 [Vibrio genomosp. F6]
MESCSFSLTGIVPYRWVGVKITDTETGYFAPLALFTQQLGGWSVWFIKISKDTALLAAAVF